MIMNVGARIKQFRNAKNYSVNKLANLAGISQSFLRDVELGNKNPTVETLSFICDALDITLCDFFADATSPNFMEDPLLKQIYKLSAKQKEALCIFLNTILDSHE